MLGVAWTFHLLFAAGIYHLMRDVPLRALARFWHGFVFGLIALTVMITIHFTILPPSLVGHERLVDWKVAIPGFINVRLFGSWTGAVFAALLGLAWTSSDHGRTRHGLYTAIAFAFALTFWTTTRAALLADLCVLPLAWIVAGRPRAHAFWSVLPLYLLAGALLTFPLQPYNDPSYTFLEANNFTSVDGFATGRLSYWTALLRLYLDHPLIGSGMMASRWLLPPFYIHPHNVVVEFLLNWGIIGASAAATLLLGAALHAHRAATQASALLPFVLMVDALAIEGLFDGMFHFAQFIMLILAGLAICLAGTHAPDRYPLNSPKRRYRLGGTETLR
jgi:O-antigen ligase